MSNINDIRNSVISNLNKAREDTEAKFKQPINIKETSIPRITNVEDGAAQFQAIVEKKTAQNNSITQAYIKDLQTAKKVEAEKKQARLNNDSQGMVSVEIPKSPTNFKQMNATAGDFVTDVEVAIDSGIVNLGNDLAKVGTTLGYGVAAGTLALAGKEMPISFRDALKGTDEFTKVKEAREWLAEHNSDVFKNKTAELEAMLAQPNLSNMDKFKITAAYNVKNPEMATYLIASSLIQSGGGMKTVGAMALKAGASIPLAIGLSAAPAGLSQGLDDVNDHIDKYGDINLKTGKKITDLDIFKSGAESAAIIGTLTGVSSGIAKLAGVDDFESSMVGGATQSTGRTIKDKIAGEAKSYLGGIALEIPEEVLGEVGSNAVIKTKIGKEWDDNLGPLAATAAITAVGQNTAAHALSNTTSGVQDASKALVNTVNNRLNRDNNVTTEERLDPTSEHYDPIKGLKDVIRDETSDESRVNEVTYTILSNLKEQKDQLTAAIENAPEGDEKIAAKDAYTKFEQELLKPVEAELVLYNQNKQANNSTNEPIKTTVEEHNEVANIDTEIASLQAIIDKPAMANRDDEFDQRLVAARESKNTDEFIKITKEHEAYFTERSNDEIARIQAKIKLNNLTADREALAKTQVERQTTERANLVNYLNPESEGYDLNSALELIKNIDRGQDSFEYKQEGRKLLTNQIIRKRSELLKAIKNADSNSTREEAITSYNKFSEEVVNPVLRELKISKAKKDREDQLSGSVIDGSVPEGDTSIDVTIDPENKEFNPKNALKYVLKFNAEGAELSESVDNNLRKIKKYLADENDRLNTKTWEFPPGKEREAAIKEYTKFVADYLDVVHKDPYSHFMQLETEKLDKVTRYLWSEHDDYNPAKALDILKQINTDNDYSDESNSITASIKKFVQGNYNELPISIEAMEEGKAKEDAIAKYKKDIDSTVNLMNTELETYGKKQSNFQDISNIIKNNHTERQNQILEDTKKSVGNGNVQQANSNNNNTVSTTTTNTGSLASIIEGGESKAHGYSDVNYGKGKKNLGPIDFSQMTYGQAVSGLNSGKFVAVGKYQFNYVSLPGVKAALPWVNNDTKLTPEVQDRIYYEYYIGKKRKGLADYIRGGNTSLNTAHEDMALEWAAVQGPNGKGAHGGNNKATITPDKVRAGLINARSLYTQARKAGKSDTEALLIATTQGGVVTIQTSGNNSTGNQTYSPNAIAISASEYATKEAHKDSIGLCAKYVRKALQASGINIETQSDAHMYYSKRDSNNKNPLEKTGFIEVENNGKYQVGDVMVTEATAEHTSGHLAIWNGTNWISDFVQQNPDGIVWPAPASSRHVFRMPGTTSGNVGGMLAMPEDATDTANKPEDAKNKTTNEDASSSEGNNREPIQLIPIDENSPKAGEAIHKVGNLFSTMTDEEIDNHPSLSAVQKEKLRQLTAFKRSMANKQNTDEVNDNVMNGYKGRTADESHQGLKQYDEILTKAIAENDVDTVNQQLAYLNRFNNDHRSKNEAIQAVLAVGEVNRSNPVWVASDENSVWEPLTNDQVANTTEAELKKAGAFKVVGENKATRAIQEESALLEEATRVWSEGTASIMEGVTPIVAQKRGSGVNENTSTPSSTSSTPTSTSSPTNTSTPTSTPSNTTEFSQVPRTNSHEAISSEPNSTYVGRANTSTGIKSMSQVNKKTGEGVGQPGWLGSTTNSKNDVENLDTYNSEFKKNFESTPTFAEGVIDLKNKKVYVNNKAKQASEAGYITDLLKVLPDDVNAAKEFVARIESYSPDTGFKLGKAPTVFHKENDTNNEGKRYVNDSDFGFDNTNGFDITTTNDERYDDNKVAIDKVIDGLANEDKLSYPKEGIGANLISAAPRTLAYFNNQVKERLGVNNGQLLAQAKKAEPRASNTTTRPKEKNKFPFSEGTKVGRNSTGRSASPTIKATKVKSEINESTKQNLTEYENVYEGKNSKGETHTISITRNKKDNTIKSFTVTNQETGDTNTPKLDDNTYSDALIVQSMASKLNKNKAEDKIKFTQAGLESVVETTEVDGRKVPTEMLDKPVNLEESLALNGKGIEEGRLSESETAIHSEILKPILNFNPKLKVHIKSGDGTNSYDKASNTITVYTKANTSKSLQEEINRLAVVSATQELIKSLENPNPKASTEELKRLESINEEVQSIISKAQQAIDAGMKVFTSLEPHVQLKILEALQDSATFISLATTDMDMINFLKSVPTSDTRKVESNIFKRLVRALSTYFNLGTSKEVSDLFTRSLEVTARIMSEQARDATVDFKSSPEAKLSTFRKAATELAINVALEMKKPFGQRNQFLTRFTQESAKSKPLTQVTNFASKLKIDLMQGLEKFNSKSPSKAQREQVANFLVFRDEMSVHIKNTFKSKEDKSKEFAVDKDGNFILDKEGNKTYRQDFRYQDMKSYLVNEDGSFDENVITAIALATYAWSVEFGNKETNRDKDIRKLLNLDPDDKNWVPKDISNQYTYLGSIKAYAMISLGKTATEALGIKDTEHASEESMSSLQVSIGEWAISAMQSADLIHIHTMSTEQHKANIEKVNGDVSGLGAIDEKGFVSFISITNKEGSDINLRLNEIVTASRNTQGYLGNLFGTEVGLRTPLLEKPDSVTTKIKRTFAKMSPKQQKLVKIMQEEPMSVNVDMLNTLQTLLAIDREATLNMIGALVTKEELANEHIDDRPSKLSAAEGVLRDLENGLDFVQSLEKLPDGQLQEFWDTIYAAKNNRMHPNSNMFNIQSSKLHRSMAEYTNFRTDIDISGVTKDGIEVFDKDGKYTLAVTFLRGVAESAEGTEDIIEAALLAKGIVVTDGYTVDKLPSEVFIEPFYDYLRTDADVTRAVIGTRKILAGTRPSKEDVAAIQKVVKFWKGNGNSLRALIEYTKFADSVEKGNATFTTSLGLGSDGINNGSALSYVQLGVATPRFLAQVGMLPEEGEYGGFNSYMETRFDLRVGDYYTGFKGPMERAIDGPNPNVRLEDESDSAYEARRKELLERQKTLELIKELNTSLTKRKSFKAVLIPFGYSAGMQRLRKLIFGQFMEDIKSQMKTVAKLDPTSQEGIDAHAKLEKDINALLDKDKQITLPTGKDILEYSIPFETSKSLEKVYDSVMGETMVQALEEYASEFTEARTHNIKMQEAAYDMYAKMADVVYKKELEVYKQHLVDTYGYDDKTLKLVLDIEQIPQGYYNEHFKPKLDALMPSVKTPFNQHEEGDTKETNFPVAKIDSKLEADPYSEATNYKVLDNTYVGTTTKLPKKYTVLSPVGVQTNSAQVQGTDAAISAQAAALGGKVNINVHDADIGGIGNYIAMGQMQNKAAFENLRDYHTQTASLLALSEVVDSLIKLNNEGLITEKFKQEKIIGAIQTIYGYSFIDDILKSKENQRYFQSVTGDMITDKHIGTDEFYEYILKPALDELIVTTRETENNKFNLLNSLAVMHQYGGEGAQYIITEADKAKIKEQQEVVDNIHEIIKNNFIKFNETKVTLTGKNSSLAKEQDTKYSNSLEKGEIVTGLSEEINSSKEVTKQGQGNNELTSVFYETGIEAKVMSPKPISSMIKRMKQMIKDSGEHIAQHRIEALEYLEKRLNAHAKEGQEFKIQFVESMGKHKGSYNPETGIITIAIDTFNGKGIDGQLEVILHEMWHATTHITRTVSTDPVVRAADKELDRMRNELLGKFPKGTFMHDVVLQSVDEFVAYGMTDPKIANDIANNLTGEYKSVGAKAKSGLIKFIKAVSRLFNGSSKELEKNFETFAKLADVLTETPSKEEVITYQSLPIKDELYSSQRLSDAVKNLQATNVSPEHNAHLDSLVDIAEDFMHISTQNLQLIDGIVNAPSDRAINAGFRLSDKEVTVLEITKETAKAFLTNQAGTKTANELVENYKQVTSQLTRDHFLADPTTATVGDVMAAQKKLDYIMKHDNVNKVEHIERYVSLALASEEFKTIIDTISNSRTKTKDPNATWLDTLMTWFTNVMTLFTNQILQTKGLNTSKEINVLYTRLNQIAKKESKGEMSKFDKGYLAISHTVTAPAGFVLKRLVNALFKTFNMAHTLAPNSSIARAALAANHIRNTGGLLAHTDQLGDVAARVNNRSNNPSKRLGLLGELLTEMARNRGMKATIEQEIRMTNKASQDRAMVAGATAKVLSELFTDISKVPKAQLDSLTQVALRTDMSALLNHGVNILRVMKLLRDPAERVKETKKLEDQIKALHPEYNDILLQTKTLALYMARGIAGNHLVKNAEGIAMGIDSWYAIKPEKIDNNLLAAIDQLASLYAVDLTTGDQKKALNDLMDSNPEAVKGILNYHLEMTKESRVDFKGNSINYIKGYMPEKTHKLRSLKFAENVLPHGSPVNALTEVEKLKTQGWESIGDMDMGQDKADKTKGRTLMFHKDMTYKDYVSGALDMKDTHAKGTVVYDLNTFKDLDRVSKAKLHDRRQRNATSFDNYNVLKQGESNLIAGYNAKGELINYHYEMSGRLRDTYLERDSNAIELLSMLNSNLTFKPKIKESQQNVAKVLYDDFVKSWHKDPHAFITLNPESTDPNIVKVWRMMPNNFREESEALFGRGNPIVIRSTAYNSTFGFHTYSMSEMFEKLDSDRGHIEKAIVTILSAMFGDKAQMRVLQGERLVQKGVAQMKDFIVIRNIKVLVGNIKANSMLLALHDIPPAQQAKDFITVWREGGKYRKLATRVAAIDSEIAVNRNRPEKLRDLNRERNTALELMARNPLHIFMEQGMMSSIVEDTVIYKEDDGYESELDKKINKLKGYLPNQVITATEWVMTSPGTPLHNFLSHSTQFSDLAAKYSLITDKMRKGISMKEAINLAQDNFINYDVPTSRGLDYLNKVGLFMFTKFIIRFQQAMINLLEKNAGTVLTEHILIEHFTSSAGVLDPLIINRIGNPFTTSLFNYNDAMSNITTVDAISSLW